jgi:hypothetical protein
MQGKTKQAKGRKGEDSTMRKLEEKTTASAQVCCLSRLPQHSPFQKVGRTSILIGTVKNWY